MNFSFSIIAIISSLLIFCKARFKSFQVIVNFNISNVCCRSHSDPYKTNDSLVQNEGVSPSCILSFIQSSPITFDTAFKTEIVTKLSSVAKPIERYKIHFNILLARNCYIGCLTERLLIRILNISQYLSIALSEKKLFLFFLISAENKNTFMWVHYNSILSLITLSL